MENSLIASEKPTVSLFLPVYKDEGTVRDVTLKAIAVLGEISSDFEIIIVDDGSPDRAGEIGEELARQHDCVRVIHHEKNLGYGAAMKTGMGACRFDWICAVDGDDEYDVRDLRKLIRHQHSYDLIITFRYVKRYSSLRMFISATYNIILRRLFQTRYRDISTGLRLIRRSLVTELNLSADSPFIGAELTIKAMLKGYRVGEVGIQTFPRRFGSGSATSWRNILATIRDMLRVYKEIFSCHYDAPQRNEMSLDEAAKTI